MSRNAIGTVVRIFMIFVLLVGGWIALIGVIYGVVCLLFGLTFSWAILSYLFAGVVLTRMFYPKNVFG